MDSTRPHLLLVSQSKKLLTSKTRKNYKENETIMLALKKKREAQAAKNSASEATTDASSSDGGDTHTSKKVKAPKLSLLGIGGKKTSTTSTNASKNPSKKRTPGEIRIQKDIAELDAGEVATIHFPNANDLTTFKVSVSPDSGYWKGATYDFKFTIPPHYPHSPPKVECNTRIYHPNIDFEGKVCLNILRKDWTPVLDINTVIYGLVFLFYEPNPDDPLNVEVAKLFREDVGQFERQVMRSLRGGTIDGIDFDRLVLQ
jgi:ubiquitin-conjugating enzyme E2 M